jgi:hypothetical protein
MMSDLIILLVHYPWILEKVRRLLGVARIGS